MHMLKVLSFLITLSVSVNISAEEYIPKSGDTDLGNALIQLNKKINKKTGRFSYKLASIFQVPEASVTVLFTHYEFTPADVLMTLSIADSSGEPVNNVAKTYFDNKKNGWEYTLYQMKVVKGTAVYQQIKTDAEAEY